jgi:hypothetical protein
MSWEYVRDRILPADLCECLSTHPLKPQDKMVPSADKSETMGVLHYHASEHIQTVPDLWRAI